MKWLPFILRNLKRKKTRTLLTVGSIAVALFLFGLLVTIDTALNMGVNVAGADRLIVRNKVSLIMPLPLSYQQRIRQIDHVTEVTHASWFGGVYQDPKNFFAQFAIDTKTYRTVFSEFVMPDDQWQAFLDDRQGAVVGRVTAERFGWEVGDRIPIQGTIWPGNWEFNLRAIYAGRADHARAMLVCDRLFDLTADTMHRRDRGLHALELGAREVAVRDLEAYLATRPSADDAEHVKRLLRRAIRGTSTLN